MTVLLGSAIKVEGGEEVVRIGQDDLHVLEEEAKRRVKLTGGVESVETPEFEINVIGVRAIAEKGRVRSKSHEVRLSFLLSGVCLRYTANVGDADLFLLVGVFGTNAKERSSGCVCLEAVWRFQETL